MRANDANAAYNDAMPNRRRKKPAVWKKSELRLLGKHPDVEVAMRTGRTTNAVRLKRTRLLIAPCKLQQGYTWAAWEVRMLGRATDAEVAERLGVSRRTVIRERQRRGIGPFRG